MTETENSSWTDGFWTSRDGLKLHYRDYAGPDYAGSVDKPPVLCLPGLTRNVRDFETLALHLAGDWRVISPEMRGRGDSAYAKDSSTYNPFQYVDDINHLLDHLGVVRYVAIGTSLGGLMTMILAMNAPERIVGAVLNDIGPVLEAAGLARIGNYVGQGRSFPTWMHAARALEESQAIAYPDYAIEDWLAMAKRLMVLSSNGRIVFDYDMKIAEPLQRAGVDAQADLWPGIEALAGKPLLMLRGALSDVLSGQTLDQMQARLPGAEALTLAGIGHAPTLDEPESVAAIERLLARCLG